MLATVGLAEWIIDDTCLVLYFLLLSLSASKNFLRKIYGKMEKQLDVMRVCQFQLLGKLGPV